MPKEVTSILLKKYTLEFGANVFHQTKIFCFINICESNVSTDKMYLLLFNKIRTGKHNNEYLVHAKNRSKSNKILTHL